MTFQKGCSGNIAGRKPGSRSVRDIAKANSKMAIETVASIVADDSAAPQARVDGAVLLLDLAGIKQGRKRQAAQSAVA